MPGLVGKIKEVFAGRKKVRVSCGRFFDVDGKEEEEEEEDPSPDTDRPTSATKPCPALPLALSGPRLSRVAPPAPHSAPGQSRVGSTRLPPLLHEPDHDK